MVQNRSHAITVAIAPRCVLLVGLGSDQRGADARIEADLLVDGARIGLEGVGLPTFGLAEHRPDQPLERSTAWSVRLAERSRLMATSVACRRWRS